MKVKTPKNSPIAEDEATRCLDTVEGLRELERLL